MELVRLEGEQARKGIEMIHGAAVYRLRGKLLPLVNLNHELRVEERGNGSEQKTPEGSRTFAGAGSDAQALDFASARSKHLLWKSRLRDFLDGKGTLTMNEAISHKDCALGKWLYSSGLQQFGKLPEDAAVGEPAPAVSWGSSGSYFFEDLRQYGALGAGAGAG